jgi:hypothetical protein
VKRYETTWFGRLTSAWERVESVVIVTAVTVLIWLYAERESIRRGELTAQVRLTAPVGQNLAINPDRFNVTIAYRCSTSQEQRLKNAVAVPLSLEVEADPADSFRFISLRERIIRTSPIAALGIEIDNVTPEGQQVSIVRLTTVRLPIKVIADDYELEGPPTIEPDEAEVQLPLSAAASAADQHLEVRLSDVDQSLKPGQTYRQRLPIVAPPQLPPPSKITPQAAEVSFTIATQTEQLTLKSVLIVLQAPPQLTTEYSVELPNDQRVLPEPVELTGQSDKIQKLAENPNQIVAVLRLTSDDFARGITSKQVEIDNLPEGVTTIRPAPRLEFKIVPRQNPNATPAPSLGPAPLTPTPAPAEPATP